MKQPSRRAVGWICIVLSVMVALAVYGRVYIHRARLIWQIDHRAVSATTVQKQLDSQNVLLGATGPVAPASKEFGLIIPKLSINVPVVKNVSGVVGREYFSKLKLGVAHQAGTPTPDVGGNTVIFGHSSNVPGVKPSQYDEVFLVLDKLVSGDAIWIDYQNQLYQYNVVEVKKIAASDVAITDNTKDNRVTLYTCWPPGTDVKRLAVVAKLN